MNDDINTTGEKNVATSQRKNSAGNPPLFPQSSHPWSVDIPARLSARLSAIRIDLSTYSVLESINQQCPIGCKWGLTPLTAQLNQWLTRNLGYLWPMASTVLLLRQHAASRHVKVWLQSRTIVGHRSITPFSAAHDHVHIHLHTAFLRCIQLQPTVLHRPIHIHISQLVAHLHVYIVYMLK